MLEVELGQSQVVRDETMLAAQDEGLYVDGKGGAGDLESRVGASLWYLNFLRISNMLIF
jgi:hypothetical protein